MVIIRESSHKKSDGERNTAFIDRLSDLPDGIICHILSFLPTKFTVATSILARRWRFLWTYVPNLDFDTENYQSATRISSVTNRVMLFRKMRHTNTFRLCCSDYECTDFELETWITIAVEGNVQNLELCLDLMTTLPRCLFTCKTLVDLELYHCIGIPSNGAVLLPCLKKLHLYSIEYKVDEALPHLLSGCPVLEELIIDGLVDESLSCFNISSPTIKSLRVHFEYDGEDYSHYNRVEINAPALKNIKLVDFVCTPVSAQMLTSLIEAEVYLDYDKKDGEDSSHFLSVLKFIDSLCYVKCLKLSSNMKLERAGDFANQSVSIRRFNNLTKLEWGADWLFLMKFLKSADHLEVLIIKELHSSGYDRVHENQKHWMKPIEVPTCLLSHLRMVRINQFGCTRQEIEMVRYVLKNARVLKRMEIYSPNHVFAFKSKFEALHIVSLFKRGSEDCEVAFY